MPNDFIGRPHVVDLRAFCALGFDEAIDPVEGHAAIVADDTAAAVGIRKTGDDAGPAAIHDLRRVGVEHAVIVRFAVFRESLVNARIRFETAGLQPCLYHSQAAEREDGALEGLVGLKSDDDFVVAVDVTGLVRQQRRGSLASTARTPFFFSSVK